MGFLKNKKQKMNFKIFKNPIDKIKNQCYNTYIVINQIKKKERGNQL